MSCVLTSLNSGCQQFGAIVRVYVAGVEEINTTTFDANDQITGLTLLYYNTFIELEPESLDATTQTLNVLTRDDRSAPARWTHTIDTMFLGTSVTVPCIGSPVIGSKQTTSCPIHVLAVGLTCGNCVCSI